jgi:YfiH family protein
MSESDDLFVRPDWPVDDTVGAVTTTRRGGVSDPPYDTLNLDTSVDDDPECVEENRQRVREALDLPARPLWLDQVHGTRVVDAAAVEPGVEADGSVTDERGVVCAVLTADCVPVLLADSEGSAVGALHAGWRGMAAGILESGVEAIEAEPDTLHAWLGPAIGGEVYEVGGEVREAFLEGDAGADAHFKPSPSDEPTERGRQRWLADLYGLARHRLMRAGIRAIHGDDVCTYTDDERFFSYRRDGETGHMASLIWLGGE